MHVNLKNLNVNNAPNVEKQRYAKCNMYQSRLAFEQCIAACAKAIRPRQGDAAPAARATTGSLGRDRTSKSSPARIVE